MIEAFKALTGDIRKLPGKSYGNCKKCGAIIEWEVTRKGRKMALVPNMGEPHIVHCGKNKWTRRDWEDHMLEILERERKNNLITRLTVFGKPLIGKAADKFLRDRQTTVDTNSEPPWK